MSEGQFWLVLYVVGACAIHVVMVEEEDGVIPEGVVLMLLAPIVLVLALAQVAYKHFTRQP